MQICGECIECCTAFPVVELNKPAGAPCVFADKGCKIYANRPQSCKDCWCAWVTQPEIGIELRPDKCGVIFEKVAENVMVATVVGSITKYALWQITSFKKQNYKVLIKK